MKNFYIRTALAAAAMLAIVSTDIFAQNFQIAPTKVVTGYWDGINPLDINVDIVNSSNSEIEMEWSRVVNEIPDSWNYSICDNGNCYPGIPEGMSFAPIPAGEKAFLKLTILEPNRSLDYATVKIAVWEKGSELRDTVTFIVATSPSSVDEELSAMLSVAPNPVGGHALVSLPEGSLSVRLVSAFGELIREFTAPGAMLRIDMNGLGSGTYFVVGRHSNGKTFVKKFQKN